MTHICYTLEEAAEKLKLSETVLVRLSQYFKVPKAAYEEVGYLSFKGDLAFSEQDLTFFQQARERLLDGESLDEVKRRIREEAVSQPPQWLETPPQQAPVNTAAPAVESHTPLRVPPPPVAPTEHAMPQPALSNEPIREIQDRKPYEKAAEQSFERYKSIHRTGLGKVFENMLKEVGASASKKRSSASATGFRPFRDKLGDKIGGVKPNKKATQPGGGHRADTLLPFNRQPMTANADKPPVVRVPASGSWDHIIQEAASQPRAINAQLKNAAQLLRERAIGDAGQDKQSS